MATRIRFHLGIWPTAALGSESSTTPVVTPRFALWVLIVVSLLVHLGWNAAIEASNDESYHYLYTVHPALSFFDHPPMTMWVEMIGLTLCGGWVHQFSLRLGFALVFACSTWVLAKWTARWFSEWAGFYAALFLNLSAYFAAAGSFALPDSSFLLFALLTMWAASEAVIAKPGRILPWVWVGLGFGAALLSKYHGIFLPAGVVLYILATPGTRKLLLSPGPYLAVLIGFAMFSPVLIWNAENGWASFRFQGGRAVGSGFNPIGLLSAVFGPIGYLLPWIWYLLIAALVVRLRRFSTVSGIERLLVCFTIVPLLMFAAVGCVRWVLPHWPLIGYVPLYPLVGAAWAEWAATNPVRSRYRIRQMTVTLLVIMAIALTQARFGLIPFPGKDPLTDASGWESVATELESRGFVNEPHTFLFTTKWFDSGQLAFALRNRVPVLCYNAGDARGFAFWSKEEQWVGWNGLYIATEPKDYDLELLKVFFEKAEKVDEFSMTRGGTPFRTVHVWRFTGQKAPFPFTYPIK